MQINTLKTHRSGIGMYCEGGIGVVVTEWLCGTLGVVLECTVRMTLE